MNTFFSRLGDHFRARREQRRVRRAFWRFIWDVERSALELTVDADLPTVLEALGTIADDDWVVVLEGASRREGKRVFEESRATISYGPPYPPSPHPDSYDAVAATPENLNHLANVLRSRKCYRLWHMFLLDSDGPLIHWFDLLSFFLAKRLPQDKLHAFCSYTGASVNDEGLES